MKAENPALFTGVSALLTHPNREEILVDLLAEWLQRRDCGEDIEAHQLCSEHPELVDELERKFRLINHSSSIWPSLIATPRPAPGPGSIFGEYVLGARLGQGGMGYVYRGRHPRTTRPIAIKLIEQSRLNDPVAVARFKQETETLANLNHPNLVGVIDKAEGMGWYLIAMELIDGLDTSKLICRLKTLPVPEGTLPIPVACEIARQVAAGLHYAHKRGIVHRDVKPPNLMITAAGEVKVIDWGVAQLRNSRDLTDTGHSLGTPDYMPPEQATGDQKATSLSDIYGLGCTLYHFLAGSPPFGSSSAPFDKMRAHQETPAPNIDEIRPGLPKGLADLLSRMLAKDPRSRPNSASEVAAALAQFAIGADLASLYAKVSQSNTDDESEDNRSKSGGLNDLQNDGSPALPGQRKPRFTRRRVIGAVAASAAILVPSIAILGLWLKAPLRILSLRVTNHLQIDEPSRKMGMLGEDMAQAYLNDGVRVEVETSSPAFVYLIALDTDGKAHVVWPDRDDQPPARSSLVALYPKPGEGYELSDGLGIQGFVALASRNPLPPSRERKDVVDGMIWQKAEGAGVWRFDGKDIFPVYPIGSRTASIPRERGQKVGLAPAPFVQLCSSLGPQPWGMAVAAICFPVNKSLLSLPNSTPPDRRDSQPNKVD